MGESSVRSGRKKGYVVLFREVAQDDRLSLEARGLFALIVSLPDDWEYTVSGLAVKAGCGPGEGAPPAEGAPDSGLPDPGAVP